MGAYTDYTPTELNYRQVVPTSGTIKNFWVSLSSDPGTAPDAYRLTLRKGLPMADTALVVTIVANDKTGNDLVNTVAVVAGDVLTIKIEPLNSPSSVPRTAWGMTFVADIDGESIVLGGSHNNLPQVTTEHNLLTSREENTWTFTESLRYQLGQDCTLKKLHFLLTGSPGAGNKYDFTLRVAGAGGTVVTTIADAATTGNSGALEDTVADGEYVNLRVVPTSSPTIRDAYWGFVCYIIPPVDGSVELFGEFVVRHSATVNLPTEFTVRQIASADLKGIVTIRHSTAAELKGIAVIRQTGIPLNLFAKFIAQPNEDLFAEFTIRHSTSQDLHAYFYVRHPYWLWTTRRYLNGVVSLSETLIGDAKLEYVIEGVMEDIQGFFIANNITYSAWTDITTVPTLIRRATTYGTVAALFARNSRTFRSRVIPTSAPITVTTIGDDERAMQHWETKMDEALENYLVAQRSTRIWVSTADEEPIFSMADIPTSAEDEIEWHQWLQQRNI